MSKPFRVSDEALANARKYGGALIGFPQSPWVTALMPGWTREMKEAEAIFATQVDYRGLVVLPRSMENSGGFWGIVVGPTEVLAAEWEERGFNPFLAWWDGIWRKDQKWIYPVEDLR